jgi:formylglycine-generating enzyme required for sulfatase activity
MKLKTAMAAIILCSIIAGGCGYNFDKKNAKKGKPDVCSSECGKYKEKKRRKCEKECENKIKKLKKKPGKCPSGFAYIRPGRFVLGSPASENWRNDDETQHRVTISHGYCMGKYEVTQREWGKVMGSNPSYFKDCGKDCPVESVSWNDVKGFLKKYNELHKGHYRLPTEAEWEYAARAGTATAFHTGDMKEPDCGLDESLDSAGWYCGNADKTQPVGKKKPNAWGLYDMNGNVWEWVQDWYGDYPHDAVTDPKGPLSGLGRVFRGGGWNRQAKFCRAATRDRFDPIGGSLNLGFRLAARAAR